MHTAEQLSRSMFQVTVDGRQAGPAGVLPDWGPADRLGVVVTEPFGGVGASHLIQLAIVCFYDLRPQRRGPDGIYPEIYLFHVGGPHGDHSPFDFWPERKEVFLPADPSAVLDAVNDKAVTRLLVPDGPRRPVTHRVKERPTARDRIVGAFAYSPSGVVRDPDVVVAGLSAQTEANARNTLDPSRLLRRMSVPRSANLKENDPAYGVRLRSRLNEAPEAARLAAQAHRDRIRVRGLVAESYRRIDTETALDMLAGTGQPEPTSVEVH